MTATSTGPIAPYFPFPITSSNGMATQQFQNYWKTAIDQAVAAALAAQQAQQSADGAEAAAEAAQTSADTAQASASTAITNAAAAQSTANAAGAAVTAETARAEAAEALLAPLAGPVFTGDPQAPTPATADNDTSIATTAFVKAQGYLTSSSASSTYAPLANPTFTGDPKAPTPTAGDNDTSIATTAFVTAALAALGVSSGTYSPTYTIVSGVTAFTATGTPRYTRIGNIVTVSGDVFVQPSAVGTAVKLNISLPIASNFTNYYDLSGVNATSAVEQAGGMEGDPTNHAAVLRFFSTINTNANVFFTFSYVVVP